MPQVDQLLKLKMEEKSLVKKSVAGQIETITLDNPSKHNALGAGLIGELLVTLSDLTNAGARTIL
jgi:enoyl-CoA hydratase/carnithine racemase